MSTTRCPYCLRNADSHRCHPDQQHCGSHSSDYYETWRAWARRTNRDDRASSLNATRAPESFYPFWPSPTNDADELESWIVRTTTQTWCVGIRWGLELLEGAP